MNSGHVEGQLSKGNFNSNLLGPFPSLLNSRATSQIRPNIGSSSGVIKEPVVGQNFNYYKGPKKKAHQKAKPIKPNFIQEWRTKGLLMDPRPKVIVAAPSSSIFSHQSQATKSIDESLPHATVETYLEAADDEAESLLANLRGLPQQRGWSEVASTALMCSESDSYTEALPLPWHEGE